MPAPPTCPQGGKIPKALEELIKEEEEEKADQEIQVGAGRELCGKLAQRWHVCS